MAEQCSNPRIVEYLSLWKSMMRGTSAKDRASRHTPRLHGAGFTLIELLVVIAIISLLSSVVLASLSSARGKAKDARRTSDLKQLQIALELYYDTNRQYPVANGWQSQCPAWGGVPKDSVIPGLAPNFMSSLPSDPDMNAPANTCCYIYTSNGIDYKLLAHNCPTLNYTSQPSLIDPARDSGSNACTVDGSGIWSWALYTPGACTW